MNRPLTHHLQDLKASGRKGLAILIDPDKAGFEHVIRLVRLAEACQVDFLLVGGSLVSGEDIRQLVPMLKQHSSLPVILFPGSTHQVVSEADGILFLSLISGRNADLLIGKQVESAAMLKKSELEVIATGYMLIESGTMTTAHYITQTLPVPANKPDIAVSTALAGELLGMHVIYMDGGSGAQNAVSTDMVKAVSQQLTVPLIIGGGIRNAKDARDIWQAGADMIVIGSALERDPDGILLQELAQIRTSLHADV